MQANEIKIGGYYLGASTPYLPFVARITDIHEEGSRDYKLYNVHGQLAFFAFTKFFTPSKSLIRPEWLVKEIDEAKYDEIVRKGGADAGRLIMEMYDESKVKEI